MQGATKILSQAYFEISNKPIKDQANFLLDYLLLMLNWYTARRW